MPTLWKMPVRVLMFQTFITGEFHYLFFVSWSFRLFFSSHTSFSWPLLWMGSSASQRIVGFISVIVATTTAIMFILYLCYKSFPDNVFFFFTFRLCQSLIGKNLKYLCNKGFEISGKLRKTFSIPKSPICVNVFICTLILGLNGIHVGWC